ncbi:ATP-binding protein [Pseudomonas kribbensis]|uniref:AlbA family DNA-binding domain-containing protein n=1 Tax=Pseudomonas kribbensis TaxID=1628086 RepID=UPI003BF8E5F2
MDDETLIQELLYRGEGSTLDYKVKQYPFSGADDSQKSELLKDILAFANAWRSDTAYILIGVKNDTGELIDLDMDIDDSRLQEFINAKTNHPLIFSYRSLQYKGVKLGLYTIPVQERPLYVRKQYGRVLPNIVYVRRGSATAIADPSEVAKMGAATVSQVAVHSPKLTIKIVCADSSVSDEFSLNYTQWALLPGMNYSDYSLADEPGTIHRIMMAMVNNNFYRELASYLQENRGRVAFSLEVSNVGDHLADDVKIFLSAPVASLFTFKEPYRLLPKPEKVHTINSTHGIPHSLNQIGQSYSIRRTREEILVRFDMGKIQVGETRRTPQVFMINPPSTLESLTGRVLSDQLRSPMEFSIPAKINTTSELLTMEKLKQLS